MKNTLRKLAMGAGMLLTGSLSAWAQQEVSVGRVDVLLPGQGWQGYAFEDKGMTLSGSGHTYQQGSEFRVLIRLGADQVVDAIVVVRANSSGKGRFTGIVFPNAQCQGAPNVYAEGDAPGAAARSFRCLQVTAPQSLVGAVFSPGDLLDVLSRSGWRLPPTIFVVAATQYANTGAFATVVAYLRPLANSANPGAMPENLPAGVSPASVQWGRQLQEAVSDSVYSISGNLQVPAFELAGAAGAAAEPATQPAAPASSPPNSQASAD